MVVLLRMRMLIALVRRFWPLLIGLKHRWDALPQQEKDRRKQQVTATARQVKKSAKRVSAQAKTRR